MSYCLYTGEMVHLLKVAEHPLAPEFEQAYVVLNQQIAAVLASTAKCDVSADTELDDGRLAAVFKPRTPGQPLPAILADFDNESEWGED